MDLNWLLNEKKEVKFLLRKPLLNQIDQSLILLKLTFAGRDSLIIVTFNLFLLKLFCERLENFDEVLSTVCIQKLSLAVLNCKLVTFDFV